MSLLTATVVTMVTLFQGIDATGTAVARPIGEAKLNSETGSYFQVFEFVGRPPHTWEHAKLMAKGYLHEGREGHLATVTTTAEHYFLVLNFPRMRQVPMWIGLSATCNETAEVTWLDGRSLAEQTFRGFGPGTLKKVSQTCRARKGTGAVFPFYYRPDDFGVRWEMGTKSTNVTYLMVEFPKPSVDEAGDGR